MSERQDKETVVESGSGAIAGIVIGGVIFVLFLFVFGDRFFSRGESELIDVDVNLSRIDAPAK